MFHVLTVSNYHVSSDDEFDLWLVYSGERFSALWPTCGYMTEFSIDSFYAKMIVPWTSITNQFLLVTLRHLVQILIFIKSRPNLKLGYFGTETRS